MTDAEARLLQPGDRVRLLPRAGMPGGQRETFVVLRVEEARGEVRIVTADLFWLVPSEVERAPEEGRP